MTGQVIQADRLALRACRVFETMDLDDAEERISRIMQPHQLRRMARGGRARSHMDFLRVQGVGLGTIAFGQSRIEVPPLDDYHLVVFCLSGQAVLRAGGEELVVDRFQGLVCEAGQPLSGRFSPDCEQFVMRIERGRLAAFAGAHVRLRTRVDLRSAGLQPWVSAMRHVVTDAATVGLIQADAGVAGDYEQLLLRLLVNGQSEAVRGPVRPASVRAARAFMEANLGMALTLREVAAAAGVAERTLHEAYRQFEGVSPMRYLRDRRLDVVRAALLSGRVGVTEAALGAGFGHLGRFARDYAQRFGERPSATRRG